MIEQSDSASLVNIGFSQLHMLSPHFLMEVLNSVSVEVGIQQAESPSPTPVSQLHCLDFGLWELSSCSRADQAGQTEGAVILQNSGAGV